MWLVGTSGVGKSTVGWQLQQALEHRNVHAAFVDADQLRNVAGVEATDDEFIADGLTVIGPIFQHAGATILIVADMVDDAAHLARLLPVGSPPVLVVHMHASVEAVVDRVEQRRWNVEIAVDSVDYAHSFDASWVDVAVDTTCQSPSQVAWSLLEGSERLARLERLDRPPPRAGGRVIEGGQLGRRRGIGHVVVTADPLTAGALIAIAKPAHLFWLDASDRMIEARHPARAEGGGPPLAADQRLGLDDASIRAAVAASIAEARDEALRPTSATIINTDEVSAEEAAREINQCAGAGVNL
ncbi:adenylyl-sulfate kinase [Arthrobacter sp. SA17]